MKRVFFQMGKSAFAGVSRRRVLVLVLSISMILSSVQVVFAHGSLPDGGSVPDNTALGDGGQKDQKSNYETVIVAMEDYLSVGDDDRLHLSVGSGSEIGVSDDIFTEIKNSMAYVNARLEAGDVDIEDVYLNSGDKVTTKRASDDASGTGLQAFGLSDRGYVLTLGSLALEQKVPMLSAYSSRGQDMRVTGVGHVDWQSIEDSLAGLVQHHESCYGQTGLVWMWYGPRIYLNSCNTVHLAGLLGAGAAAAGLCAWLSGASIIGSAAAPACGLLGLLAGFQAATILYIHSLGGNHGIYIQWTWVALGWVWHQ